jgi:nucleotide-binding universal stress UspA family protein
VHDAIPVLRLADEVVLSEIVANETWNGRYTISINDVADHLRAHGVPVKVRRIQGGSGDAGGLLLGLATEIAADLFVAGGYGHSRLREWVLGGVTASVLEQARIPYLLSH